jgi:iron(III) transport system substrate-binding protein
VKATTRAVAALLPLALLIALPLSLRPEQEEERSTEVLVIITPHNEATRSEFAHAFAEQRKRSGKSAVTIDWRTPGGVSDMVRFIDDQFRAGFLRERGTLSAAEAANFNDAALDAPERAQDLGAAARRAFMAGTLGIGIDIVFGGGQFDFGGMATKGYLVDCGVSLRHPEWLSDDVIPERIGGEIVRDRGGRYIGACLASFGLCYNRELWVQHGLSADPSDWSVLGEPRFFAEVEMADPSKSGSIARCFEMIIQQRMALAEQASGIDDDASRAAGWADAFVLIKRIAANARTVTDSAAKVTRDVGRGDAALGMCIDFYGRSESEWTRENSGRETIRYVTVPGGTSISADPIALLRGAPNAETARDFIDFVLSPEGQRLWNYRHGEPGGPRRYSLRRWPVRRDSYSAENRAHMSDPDENPYELARLFRYRPEWTGASFGLIRTMIKTVVLDSRNELSAAWQAIIAAGGPDAVPEAMHELAWLPVSFAESAAARERLRGRPVDVLRLQREWTESAQRHYRAAAAIALGSRP